MRRDAGRDPRAGAPAARLGAEGGERLTPPEAEVPTSGSSVRAPLPPGLYVVATPIGNLEDVTLRALRVLRSVDLVAAEDTRRTRTLLQAHGLHTPLAAYHAHNQARQGPALLRRLEAGARIALVTDAGTPGISDPGFPLVRACHEAGVAVVPIPGPSAVAAVLSAAGVPADRFVFEGFLPMRAGRRLARLRALRDLERPIVLYEGPHRLAATLQAIEAVFGDAEVVLAREVTKLFEEFRRGTAAALRAGIEATGVRGEVTLVVNPRGERGEDSEGDPVGERAARPDDDIEDTLDAPVGATQAMAVEGRQDG